MSPWILKIRKEKISPCTLFDASGKPVKTLFDGPANYPGKASLSFALHTLPAGQYLVQVMLDRQEVVTRSVVKL